MKKIIISATLAVASLCTYAQSLPPTGYYRVQNLKSSRYITINDDYGSLNIPAATADMNALRTYSYDDGINSKSTMTINDGSIYSYATGNDGIDSNGNLIVNGGVVVGCGASAPEEGIDAAEGYTFSINGGTVVGIGGGGEAMAGSQQKASLNWIREQSLDPNCVESLANHDPDIVPHVIEL